MKKYLIASIFALTIFFQPCAFATIPTQVSFSGSSIPAAFICVSQPSVVYSFMLNGSGGNGGLTITDASFHLSSSVSLTDVTSFELWKGATFGGSSMVGSVANDGSSTTFDFSSLSEAFDGSTNRTYWIKAIVAATGTDGDHIQITMSSTDFTPGINPAAPFGGSIQTIVTAAPSPSITNAVTEFCSGSNFALTSTSAETSTFAWTGPNGFTSSLQNPAGLSLVTADAGSYQLTATNGCGSNNTSFVITVDTAAPIIGASFVCGESSTALVDGSADGVWRGGTWGSSNTAVATVDGTGNVSGLGTVTVTTPVIITYTNGLCSVTATVTVIAQPAAINGPANICGGTASTVLTDATAGGTWSSSNLGAAAIGASSGLVTATAAGGATDIVYSTGCTDQHFSLNVYAKPTVNFPGNQSACDGAPTTAVSFTGTNADTYMWSYTPTSGSDIGYPTSGTGDIPSFTAIVGSASQNVATFTVTPSNSGNGCSGIPQSFTITANPIPTLNSLTSTSICESSTVPFAYTPSSSTSLTAFSWTYAAVANITAPSTSGTGSINQIMHNTDPNQVVAVFVYSLSANGCSNIQNLTVSVNPTPVLLSTVTPTSEICSGNTYNFTATSATSPVSYAWSRGFVAGVTAPSSGATASISETLATTNDNTTIVQYVFTLTATGGCTNTQALTASINPIPALSSAFSAAICNNTAFNYAPTSNTTPLSVAWSRPAIGSGFAVNGTGNISEVINNSSFSTPLVVPYTLILSSKGCNSLPQTVNLTVSPSPSVDFFAGFTVCNADIVTPPIFTGPFAGTQFNWTNLSGNNFSTGPQSGLGSIGTFTASNTVPAASISAIKVIGTIPGCLDTASTTFNITVNPTPQITLPASALYCNGDGLPLTTLTGTTAPLSTYSWTNDNTNTNILGSGGGTIPAAVLTNTASGTPITSNITITASIPFCADVQQTFAVSVNPIPTVDPTANILKCNHDLVSTITFSGSSASTTYSWSASSTADGIPAGSGTASIPSFNVTAPGATVDVNTINVMPSIAKTGGTCQAASPTPFTITVQPSASINPIAPVVKCNGDLASAISLGGSTSSLNKYVWIRTNADSTVDGFVNGTDSAGVATIPGYTAVNNGTNFIVDTIVVTATVGGCASTIDSAVFTVRINPTPMLSSTLTPIAICDSTVFTYVPQSLTPGSTFAWTRGVAQGISDTARADTGYVYEILANTTDSIKTTGYVYTTTANSCTYVQTVTATVNPRPRLDDSIITSPKHMCNDGTFTIVATSPTDTGAGPGVAFAWYRDSIAGITPARNNGSTAAITDTMHNATDTIVAVTYVYTITANGCSATKAITDTVYPTPTLKATGRHFICNNDVFRNPLASFTPNAQFSWMAGTIAGVSNTDSTDVTTVINDRILNSTNATKNVVFTVTVTANGCSNPAPQFDSVSVRPTAHLSDLRVKDTAICSDDILNYQASSDMTAADEPVKYTWHAQNNPNVSVGTATSPDSTGSIVSSISSHYSHHINAVKFVYTLFINANDSGKYCSSEDSITVDVKPHAQKPRIVTPEQTTYCNGLMYQNFSSSDTDNTLLRSNWAINDGDSIFLQDSVYGTHCLVNFNDTGNATLSYTVWVTDSAGTKYQCPSSDAVTLNVTKNTSPIELDSVYAFSDDSTLFCNNNTLKTFEWGYDRKDSLTPHPLIDKNNNPEINQDCEFDHVTNGDKINFISLRDADKYYFWVKTRLHLGNDTTVTYVQKNYYWGTFSHRNKQGIIPSSTTMLTYPNPAQNSISFELSDQATENTMVRIYDVFGKEVRTAVFISNKVTVAIDDLPQGNFYAVCTRNGIKLAFASFIKL